MTGPSASGERSVAVGINLGVIATGDGVTFNLRAPAEPLQALSGLPAENRAFTGRDRDLKKLLALLEPTEPTEAAGPAGPTESAERRTGQAPRAVIAGMGGIGKTELALRAARAALGRGWFPGGVLFYDLRGYGGAQRATPDEALGSFLIMLGVPGEAIPADSQAREACYRTILEKLADAGRSILVVIDNASGIDQVRSLLPGDDKTGVIITSRHTLSLLGLKVLDLEVLKPEAAIALLEASLRNVRGDEDSAKRVARHRGDAAEIARLCGYLPLALVIIAARLARPGSPPLADVAGELADELYRLDELSDSVPHGVRATLDMSCQLLTDDQKRVFRLLAVCPGADVSTETAAGALTGLAPPVARRALENLADAHLAEPGAPGRWRMHDLVRLYAAELNISQPQQQDRDRERILRCYLETVRLADDHLRALPGENTPARFRDRNGALAWLDAERANLIACVTSASDSGLDRLAQELALSLPGYLDRCHRYEDWHAISVIAQAAAGRTGDQLRAGAAFYNKGLASLKLRRHDESVTAFEQAAGNFHATGNRYGQGLAQTGLGLALWEKRSFTAAIAAHQRAAEIYRETEDQHGRSVGLNSLVLPRPDV
jgi:tetratricopeptide (TPR) repeat protein